MIALARTIEPRDERHYYSLRAILAVAREYFQFSLDDLTGQRKWDDLADARQMTIWVMRCLTDRSYPEIGLVMRRDHTSIMHAVSRAEQRAADDPDFKARLLAFLELVRIAAVTKTPDQDPFQVAEAVTRSPRLAVNVSVDTIRAMAAIVVAAHDEASVPEADWQAELAMLRDEIDNHRRENAALRAELLAARAEIRPLVTALDPFLTRYRAMRQAQGTGYANIELDRFETAASQFAMAAEAYLTKGDQT